ERTRPRVSSTVTASRRLGRLMPSCSASSRWPGSMSPERHWPRARAWRSFSTTELTTVDELITVRSIEVASLLHDPGRCLAPARGQSELLLLVAVGLLARLHGEPGLAVEHVLRTVQVDITLPAGNGHGGDAVADQVG